MAKLSDVINNGNIQREVSVRVDNSISKDEQVTVHYELSFDGMKVADIIGIDYNVRFASTLRNSFDSQETLRNWAEENGSKENPYKIHISNLGKKIVSKEQRKAELLAMIRSLPEEERKAVLGEVS